MIKTYGIHLYIYEVHVWSNGVHLYIYHVSCHLQYCKAHFYQYPSFILSVFQKYQEGEVSVLWKSHDIEFLFLQLY